MLTIDHNDHIGRQQVTTITAAAATATAATATAEAERLAEAAGVAALERVQMRRQLEEMEAKMVTGDYQVQVHHPYAYLLEYAAAARLEEVAGPERSKALMRAAWHLANDCLRTDLVLRHPPHVLALGCLRLAGALLKLPAERWLGAQLEPHAAGAAAVVAGLSALFEQSRQVGVVEEVARVRKDLDAHWAAARAAGAAAAAPAAGAATGASHV